MTGADMLEAWRGHLAEGRRRSPHTVRAYGAAAARLIARTAAESWRDLARIDGPALRAKSRQLSAAVRAISRAAAAP